MCHNSNGDRFVLNGSQRKTAYALEQNVARMFQEAGLEKMGFLTLTVGDETPDGFRQVFSAEEASRRINSAMTGFLRDLFARAVIVTERHKSRAVHFHLIVECRADIRTGFDFVAFKAGRGYAKTATAALRALWGILRERLPAYGFGRAELSPIFKTGEAVSRYVSKYVEKNLMARREEDRGKKLVRYMGWKRKQMTANGFSWATPGACEWRKNVAFIAALHGVNTRDQARAAWGSRWAHRLTEVIVAVEKSPQLHQRVAVEFVRSWSERAMIDPVWWRTEEDIFRQAEMEAPRELDDEFISPEEIAATWDWMRAA